jgi:hypothetical protein
LFLPLDPAPEDQEAGAILFDQQMWCWGRDIRRPEGNALLLYGLERDAPPPESRLGPVYHLSPAPGARLILAGFGLFYSRAGLGALYLARQRFSPCLLRRAAFPAPCWKVHAVPPHRPPETAREWERARLLMSQALSWTAAYEEWVWREIGPDHRRRCVADWFKQTVPAETMAAEWRALAGLYEADTEKMQGVKRDEPSV